MNEGTGNLQQFDDELVSSKDGDFLSWKATADSDAESIRPPTNKRQRNCYRIIELIKSQDCQKILAVLAESREYDVNVLMKTEL